MNEWHLARGYRFAGIVSGLRSEPDRRDLAVVVSDRPATAAGVFTQNRVCAAPVQVSRERLPRADARAIVVCSGNANACTGEQGLADARRMAELVAIELRCTPEQVLVASTGVIGRPLPMPVLEAGIPEGDARSRDRPRRASAHAAHAILTTDTGIKIATREFPGIHGHRVRQGRGDDRPEHGDHARLRPHRRGGGRDRPAPHAEGRRAIGASTASPSKGTRARTTPSSCSPTARAEARGARSRDVPGRDYERVRGTGAQDRHRRRRGGTPHHDRGGRLPHRTPRRSRSPRRSPRARW